MYCITPLVDMVQSVILLVAVKEGNFHEEKFRIDIDNQSVDMFVFK